MVAFSISVHLYIYVQSTIYRFPEFYKIVLFMRFFDHVVEQKDMPGYQEIPPHCPQWKRDLLEKKNCQALEDYIRSKEAEISEKSKWISILSSFISFSKFVKKFCEKYRASPEES